MKDKPLYEFLFPVVSGGDARVIVCRVETPTGKHIELQLPLFGGPDPVLR